MTIVFLCRLFYPHIGGVEKHVYEVGKRLQKKGMKVLIITEQYDPSLAEKEIYKGFTIYRIPVRGSEKEKKYRIWNWLFAHKSLLKKAKIIHCHDVTFWYMPFRILFPRKKIYNTFHGYEGDSVPTARALLVHKLSEVIAAGSIVVGDYLRKWYKSTTQYVTYGGVGVLRHEDDAHVKKIEEIVFIGRLDPEAGIMRFLDVMNILKQSGYQVHLSVLGDGILADEAKKFVRRHRLNVSFYGFVPEVGEFLARADCVFTSRFLSTLESFAYRKYVFCLYNNPIHRDCFILSPFHQWMSIHGESAKLAKSVISLIHHPHSKDEDISRAHQWVKQQTWEKVTKLYLALWKI